MNASIGPHEGQELELMREGIKPLSMFVEVVPSEATHFPEDEFDRLVAEKRLVKFVAFEEIGTPDGRCGQIKRILYALPAEAWRIKSMLLVQQVYSSLRSGWHPDLDRVIGTLLGYSVDDIEAFVNRHE
jgi:hypothetical protein